MPTGTVKLFNLDRGFGFIRPDEPGSDVFFHIFAVESGKEPRIGQQVTYEIRIDRKTGKEKATSVR